jgi:hypothetical protein
VEIKKKPWQNGTKSTWNVSIKQIQFFKSNINFKNVILSNFKINEQKSKIL